MDAYTGEIRIWSSSKIPQNWAPCDGRLLPLASYQPLFTLLGTTYGGDGRTNFAIPDLRGKAPIHQGTGPGLTPRAMAATVGAQTVTLSEAQMPSHSHYYMASTAAASSNSPNGAVTANVSSASLYLYATESASGTAFTMDSLMIGQAGGGQDHSNWMPTMALNMIICLNGLYPTRD